MKYLKNIIKNIKWFVCNDIGLVTNDIYELENIINENYQTLLNKTIDNKNSINQRLVNINNEIQALKDIRVLDNKMMGYKIEKSIKDNDNV